MSNTRTPLLSLLSLFSLSFAFCLSSSAASDVYVFKGNPYDGGHFDVSKDIHTFSLWAFEGVKYHCVVNFPKIPGRYSAVFFIGGLGGIIPAEVYTDMIKRMAAHGYVIIGVDNLFGGVFPPSAEEVLSWLQNHLQRYIDERVKGVTVAWDHLGLVGHSAGAQSVLDMVMKDHKIANATLFLEGGWVNNLEQIDFVHPALVYGTEFATRKSTILPECGSEGQAEGLYNDWRAPRVLMNVSGFGHCDMLDPLAWEGCHLSDFCYTQPENNRTLYRQFTQGLFSAFLGFYVQRNKEMLPYFTDKSTFLGITFTDFHVDLTGVESLDQDVLERKKRKKKKEEEEEEMEKRTRAILSHKQTAGVPFWKNLNNNNK